ncbi:gamma carbonic anhydrase family protein [Glaciibacter psychrotolerans]|uniref:Phenylacetic acid degradation protein n=1 Tax=Glaciibacter psychrotolerans TaxID=670054 RepID=A0A7Z0J6J8_9MICO|nr:phenylacetic acid degradation protein PaaY [Leifsonia psychrotolerans]NYJ20465.1 phenylacetic acid degradation protein [Leifsonia psychrotolerans]
MPCYEIDGVVPVVDPTAFVHESAILIGDVIVEAGCYIGPNASLRGDFGRILVGAGSNVQDNSVIHAFPGADAVLSPGSHIGHGVTLHGCTIGSYALIGIGSIVLDGAEIGHDALIGAGSLVTAGSRIPAGVLAHGRPATVVRELDEDTLSWKRDGVRIYQELAQRSLGTLRRVEPLAQPESDRPRVSTGPDVSRPLHESRADGPPGR